MLFSMNQTTTIVEPLVKRALNIGPTPFELLLRRFSSPLAVLRLCQIYKHEVVNNLNSPKVLDLEPLISRKELE